jgi:Immunoglobulin-like domain of bacterial spore germination/Sporulation and spore germination
VPVRVAAILVVAALLAGCGGKHHAAAPAKPTTALEVYFYRGAALVPTVVHVPQTQAVGTAALGALLAGPPSGYTTALPAHAQLQALSIVDDIATAQFDSSLAGLPRTGQAQIVYTLTQFRTVHGVEASVGAAPLQFQDGAGQALNRPVTRDDFVDLTPLAPIFVAAPARDSTVASPVHARGTSDVFEGTMQVDVYSGGTKIATRTITATAGSGTRGTWQATFTLPPGPALLDFYEPSQENGAHLHETVVDFTVLS